MAKVGCGQLVTSGSQSDPHCWMCLKCIITDQNHYMSTSFQMLMRYLSVDLVKLWRNGNLFQNKFNKENMCLCETCSLKVDEFWYFYQEFEALRLSLDDSVENVYSIIKESEDDEEQTVLEGGRNWDKVTTEITTLRRETLRMCYFRTRSVPRVQLRKTPTTKHLAGSISCNYCSYSVDLPSTIKDHMVLQHTMEFYSNQIPSGTNKTQLSAAAHATVEEHLAHPKNHDKDNSKVLNCASCQRSLHDRNMLKMHILKEHFDEVMTTLSEMTLTSTKEQEEETPFLVNDMHEDNHGEVHNSDGGGDSDCDVEITPLSIEQSTIPSPEQLNSSTEGNTGHYLVKLQNPNLLLKPLIYSPLKTTEKSSRDHKCAKCKTSYSSKKLLNDHLKSQHSMHQYFPCKFCDTVHLRNTDRRTHMIFHHTFIFFKDKLPSGTSEEEMTKAIQRVLSRGIIGMNPIKYECPQCMKSFRNVYDLKNHVLRMHFHNVISELLKTKSSNIQTSESNVIKNSSAPARLRNIYGVKIVKRLLKNKTAIGKLFKCVKCRKSYSSRTTLRQHVTSHFKTFPCQYCNNIVFSFSIDRRTHMLMKHTFLFFRDKLPLGTTKEGLDTIIENILSQCRVAQRNEGSSNSNNYRCLQCLKDHFRTPYDFKRHLLRVHFQIIVDWLNGKKTLNGLALAPFYQRPSHAEVSVIQSNEEETFDKGVATQKENTTAEMEIDLKFEPIVLSLDGPADHDEDDLMSSSQDSLLNIETETKPAPASPLLVDCTTSVEDCNAYQEKNWNQTLQKPLTSSKLKCVKCKTCYSSKKLLHQHKKSNHESFPCQHCNVIYLRRNDRKDHLMLKHSFLFFKDKLPSGTSEEEMNQVINRVFLCTRSKGKYDCPQCKKSFNDVFHVKRHVLQMHFQTVISELLTRGKP